MRETAPQRWVRWVAQRFPDAVFYKQTTEPVVALTIDDVPTPDEPGNESTQWILDAIATHNQSLPPTTSPARATFFIITSHLAAGSDIIERINAAGHEVANHGVTDETVALQSAASFSQQLQAAHACIRRHTHQPIRWYRPGRGFYNAQMVETLRQFPGYEPRLALASMIPLDTFQLTRSVSFTTWYVTQHIFPGAILLLHGGSAARAANAAAALPLILQQLHRQGYQVATLSELWDFE